MLGYVHCMPDGDELRLAEAARRANVTVRVLRLAVGAGDLAMRADGRRMLFLTADLDRWIERHGLTDLAPT